MEIALTVFPFRMALEPKPPRAPLCHSSASTSTEPPDGTNLQLPDSDGVDTSVSATALDAGMLVAGTTPPFAAVAGGQETTDAQVMLRVKAGDQASFDYLVQKYRRSMVSFMYRMARNTAAAEDLAQEVFLRVYRSRASYEASAKFTTWLYRIATNLAVNHARDTRHERPENMVNLDEPDSTTGQTPDLADSTPTIEEDIVRQERLTAIRQKVQALPE